MTESLNLTDEQKEILAKRVSAWEEEFWHYLVGGEPPTEASTDAHRLVDFCMRELELIK